MRNALHEMPCDTPERLVVENVRELARLAVQEMPVPDALRALHTAQGIIRESIEQIETEQDQ